MSLESDEEGAQSEIESDQEEAEYSRKMKDSLDMSDGDSDGEDEKEISKQSSAQRRKPGNKKPMRVAVVQNTTDENMVNDSMIVDRESSAIVSPARQDTKADLDDKGNNYYGK